jgi:hypothetical protein
MLQNLSNGVFFKDKEMYMVPLNKFLKNHREMLADYFDKLIDIEELQDALDVRNYREFSCMHKRTHRHSDAFVTVSTCARALCLCAFVTVWHVCHCVLRLHRVYVCVVAWSVRVRLPLRLCAFVTGFVWVCVRSSPLSHCHHCHHCHRSLTTVTAHHYQQW